MSYYGMGHLLEVADAAGCAVLRDGRLVYGDFIDYNFSLKEMTLKFKKKTWISPLWQDMFLRNYKRNNGFSETIVGEIVAESPDRPWPRASLPRRG